MAGGNVKYTFQVDANTSQAKKAMDELRRSMDKLSEAQEGKSFFNENLNQAVASAKELKYHLNQAMDAKTGQLNLNVFNKSLKDAGQSATQLMQSLLQGGAQGQQTFIALASAIAQSEAPLRRMNQNLKDFGTTLKNTVKWELSSSIVHGLESAFSGAVSYAKNLNSSLTDIRIVTGKSVEDMTRFAEQANKAAKSLSTTTKAYTNASLIYFQQGDSEEDVAKKAAITIKAANASAKTSTAEMSEYLTAVWNSYQVGADELERYVDIMAALGAKTATSLEEIATSMQKVAATGNTVGVSMEQVSSIIATVSSVTRESAESIGTSYKTIFARMGDLKLGAKDEDGIGLGQVSKSLESIGVEVLDASGDLRDMGDIITDLGNKWQTMSNAEKTAIAQVVAGKRQYTQLMALFENWDMYQDNMAIAGDSEGALQDMADIYAESWEAASARAAASMEAIYSQLLNDQAIIKFTDSLASITDAISGIIDSFGGLTGVLTRVGAIATAVFQKSMAKGIGNVANSLGVFLSQFQGKNIKQIFGMFSGNQIKSKEQIEYNKNNQAFRSSLDRMIPQNQSEALAINSAKTLLNLKEQLIGAESKLSDTQKVRAQSMIGDLSKEQNKLIEMQQEYDKYEEEQKNKKRDLSSNLVAAAQSDLSDIGQNLNSKKMKEELDFFFSDADTGFGGSTNVYAAQITDTKSAIEVLQTSMSDMAAFDVFEQNLATIKNSASSTSDSTEQVRAAVEALKDSLSGNIDARALDGAGTDIEKLESRVKKLRQTTEEFVGEDGLWDEAAANIHSAYGTKTEQALNNIKNNAYEEATKKANMKFGLAGQQSIVANSESAIKKLFAGNQETVDAFGKSLSQVVGTAMSVADAFQSGAIAVETLTDETASLGSKMMSVASAASSLVSGFMSGGPWGLILSAVGLIASVVIQGFEEAEEKRKELFDKTLSDAEQKTADNSAELSNAQDLLNTYNELYARYKAGENVQSELTASAMALAEAYGIADAAIAAMSGDFDQFNQKLEENLKFTKQLTDAENAKTIAEGAVGQAKVGKIKNVSDTDLGFIHFTDSPTVETQEAVASAEGAILSYAENLMLSRDTDTWKFLDQAFAQGADVNDEWIGDYTFGATTVLRDFINFAKEEGENAQSAFDDLMASHGIEDIDMGDKEAILTALEENGISVGAFLEHFYSLVIKKGTENLSLLDSGFSMKEVGSWGETTVIDQLPDLITDVNAIIMEPFQEQVEQAAFSLESIKGEYSDLWDSESGKFTWDDNASAARKLELYERYVAWEEQLRQRLTEIGADSPEAAMIQSLLTEIEKITGNEELTTSIGVYKDATENLQRWTIVQNSMKNFLGKNPLNTTFSDYIAFHEDIIKTIDSQPAAYDELEGLTPEDGEEYIQKRNMLAQRMIADSSAFDDYATMYTSILSSFEGKQLDLVTGLIDAEQMSLDEITSDFIDVLKIFFANAGQSIEGLTVEDLVKNELISSVMDNREAVLDFNEHQTGYEKAKTAASRLSQDMSMEESQNLYDGFWGNEELISFMESQGDPLISFEQFIGKSYEERSAYLDNVTDKYLTQVEADANKIISTHEASIIQLTEQAGKISQVFESEQGRELGQSLYEGFIGNYTETDQGWINNLDPSQVYADKQQAFDAYKISQGTKFDPFMDMSLQDWENFHSIQQQIMQQDADYADAQGFLQWMQLIGDESLTTTEKIQTYSDAVSSLASEYSNFAKTGKLSTKAMQDFAKLGINPNNIKNATDYIDALRIARDNAQGLLEDLMYEGYNAKGPGEGVEVGSEEYNQWLEVRNLQLEVMGLNDTIFNTTISNGEAQISAMEAKVNKLKEDAEKIKETAEILESSIESGQLSHEQQARLEAEGFDLTGWKDATTAMERANIVAKQYSQYAIDIAKASEETSTFYEDAADNLHGFDDKNLGDLSVQENFDKILSDMVQYGDMADDTAAAWKKAYETMSQQTDGFTGMSNMEIIKSVREELERLGEEAGDAGLIAAAVAKDSMHEIFQSLADENAAAADAAVNAWEDAFNRIAELRKKILSGENIQDDIFGQGIDNLLQAFLDSGESNYGTFSTAVKTGKYKPDLPTFDNIDQFWSSIGLDSYLAHGAQNMRDLGIYYAQQADAQGLTGSERSAYIIEQSKSDANTLLNTFLGYYDTKKDQQNDIINSWLTNDTESLYDYNGGLVTATELLNNAAQILSSTEAMFTDMQEYAQLEETATEIGARSLSRYMLTGSEGEVMTSVSGEIMSYDYISQVFDAIMRNHDAETQSDISSADTELLTGAGISLENLSNLTQAASSWGTIMEEMASRSYQDAFDMAGGAEKYGLDALTNKHYNLETGTSDPIAEQLDVKLEELESVREKIADSIDEVQRSDFEDYNIDTAAWEELSDTIQETAKQSEELADSLANDAEAADEVAKDILRYDKAIKSIKDNYKDWIKTLEKGSLEDQADTVKELDRAYSDMLDLDYGILSKEFVKNEKNLKDMEEAAKGSEEAYNRLSQAAKEDIAISADLDLDNFEDGFNELMSKYYEGQNLADMEVGASLNNAAFLQGLSDMVNAAGLTAAQATSLLSSMGVDAEVIETPVEAEDEQTYTGMTAVIEDVGWSATLPIDGSIKTFSGTVPSVTYEPNPQTATDQKKSTSFALKVTSANKSSGGGFKHSKGGGGGGGSGGGGGGGKKKQKKEHKRPQDEKERYHRNNSAIKQVENELKKLTAAKDSAYGKNYVDAIDAETAALRREREEQEKLRQEALSYKAEDASKLIAAGAIIGENDVIENYDELIQSWVNEYNAAVDAWNDSAQEENDQEEFDKANQLYEDRMQLIQDYEEALDVAADAEARLQEILNEISENTLEGITYTLELELEVNERDLELLEYYREQYEETLQDQDNLFANLIQQAGEYETNFASLQDAYRNLMDEYDNGKGDLQADEYAEGLADLHSQILENLQNLQDIKDEIAEVYANALDLATEEIENATEALDHMNETMEAYIAIMGLSGRETDYATMQAFYDAQFATNMANIEAQTEMLAGLREQEEYFKNRKEQNGELTDLEQEQYEALMEKIRETENAVLDSTQTTLEVLQAGYENTINRIAQDLDEFMAGAAGSISHLQEQYAYFQEEQSRYVSTAKELYEVSSLNREIENTLAETTSAASKEALKALQEKINKQSELNEMTEYDIEMNQLQYQLLLARIQLEEAQNSKDTVRLTRDDNGNYAYQYTADEDKVSEAMQKYEDTLQQINDLTVERTSEIEQQMINSMAEYEEKMQEIAMDTTLSESEKYNRLLELQSQFDAEMAYLQEQAGIANENLLANQEAIADHYGVNITAITSSTAGNVNQTIQDMIANAQQYSTAMHDALFGPDGVSQSWSDYLAAVTTVQQASGTTVDDMLNNTANVGEVNEDAVQTALDAVEALTGTLKPINQMTEAWNAHQEALQGTIDSYENLLVHINDLMAALGQTNTNPNLDPEGTNINASAQAAAVFDTPQEEPTTDEINPDIENSMPNEEEILPDKKSGGGGGGGKKTPQYDEGYYLTEVTKDKDDFAVFADYTNDLADKINEVSQHYLVTHQEIIENEELTELEKYKQFSELQNNFNEEMEKLRESYKKQQLEYTNLIDESKQMYDLWLNQIDTLTQFSMLNSYHAQGLINEAPVVIDQNVTIEAEFPNVSSTDEIIEAFNELINRAAQFASAKK